MSFIESWTEFVVWFFVFALIVCIIAACIPRSRRWVKSQATNIIVERPRDVAANLRTQVGSVVVPEFPLLTTPTEVPFTRPADSTHYRVYRTGNYRLSYNLQLVWSAASDVAAAVNGTFDSNTNTVDGSQRQTSGIPDSAQDLNADFVVHLKRGTVLTLVCAASVAGAVVIPASSTSTLISPTTLASLSINEV